MPFKKQIQLLLLGLSLPLSALSAPLMWETDIGAVLTDLTGQDDQTTSVDLSFDFPFDGTDYTTIFIGTNGGIQMGSLGNDGEIDYEHFSSMEEFVSDLAPTVIVNADFDLTTTGTVHFNDLAYKAVFTWNEIGTDLNELALSSFQIQLFPSGGIYISMNGILDDPGENLIADLGTGIVLGISAGLEPALTDPGPSDLTQVFNGGTEIFGRWCYDVVDSCGYNGGVSEGLVGGLNTDFDLDLQTITFTPIANGYAVNDIIFANSF